MAGGKGGGGEEGRRKMQPGAATTTTRRTSILGFRGLVFLLPPEDARLTCGRRRACVRACVQTKGTKPAGEEKMRLDHERVKKWTKVGWAGPLGAVPPSFAGSCLVGPNGHCHCLHTHMHAMHLLLADTVWLAGVEGPTPAGCAVLCVPPSPRLPSPRCLRSCHVPPTAAAMCPPA